jgi:hypothetical protein
VQELLNEAGRGISALFSLELLFAALVSVVVVGAVAWSARRDGRVAAGWPPLVVASVALAVRERAVLPLLVAGAGWWLLQRIGAHPPARPGRSGLLLVASMMTGLGLFGTLPEPKEAAAIVAALAVVAMAGLVGTVDLERITGPQLGALLGMLVWVCFAGDGQRLRALVAGLLCVAMLAIVAALLDGAVAALLVLHVVVTVAASRWVGLATDTAAALLRALPVVIVAVVGVALVRRLSPRQTATGR